MRRMTRRFFPCCVPPAGDADKEEDFGSEGFPHPQPVEVGGEDSYLLKTPESAERHKRGVVALRMPGSPPVGSPRDAAGDGAVAGNETRAIVHRSATPDSVENPNFDGEKKEEEVEEKAEEAVDGKPVEAEEEELPRSLTTDSTAISPTVQTAISSIDTESGLESTQSSEGKTIDTESGLASTQSEGKTTDTESGEEDLSTDEWIEEEPPKRFATTSTMSKPRGVVNVENLKTFKQLFDADGDNPILEKLSYFEGDITKLEVDAIVNAANAGLRGGGGIDGVIHSAAGHNQLQDECRKHETPLETGRAVSTSSCKLDTHIKRIIHAVGPMIGYNVSRTQREQLISCYRNTLKICEEEGLRTVALCCISTGIYSYPNDQAAVTVMHFLTNYLAEEENRAKFDHIVLCCFMEIDRRYYQAVAKRYVKDNTFLDKMMESLLEEEEKEEEEERKKDEERKKIKEVLEQRKKDKAKARADEKTDDAEPAAEGEEMEEEKTETETQEKDEEKPAEAQENEGEVKEEDLKTAVSPAKAEEKEDVKEEELKAQSVSPVKEPVVESASEVHADDEAEKKENDESTKARKRLGSKDEDEDGDGEAPTKRCKMTRESRV